jgi:transposase
MAAAYSMDLRERVITDSDAGLSSKELAERYHVSGAWVDALKQRRRETGSIAPRKQTKFRRRVLEGQEDRLRALVTAQPDATLVELRDRLRMSVALATIWRELNQLDLTGKKKPYTPTNNGALTSRCSGGVGATGCRYTMPVSMCFWTSAA